MPKRNEAVIVIKFLYQKGETEKGMCKREKRIGIVIIPFLLSYLFVPDLMWGGEERRKEKQFLATLHVGNARINNILGVSLAGSVVSQEFHIQKARETEHRVFLFSLTARVPLIN